VIGGGGFGIVHRAWDHQLERTIAIKEFMLPRSPCAATT
jgi:serine/threonine protein kinase